MSSKPNILVIGVSCFDGMAASMRVKNLLSPLIKKDSITVNNLIYKKEAIGLLKKEDKLNNINYCVIGFSKSKPFSAFSFMWRGIKFITKNKSRHQKNIIYNYDQPDLRNILFLIYARLIGYKIILDVIEDNRYYTSFSRWLTKIKIKSSIFFTKHLNFYTSGVLAISQHLYDEMMKLGKGKVPVYLIPVTVNFKHFKMEDYHIPAEIKIFYGGTFADKDGVEFLIKAFEQVSVLFKNIHLNLSGKGTEENMQHYYQLIENSCAKEKITLLGYLESDEYYKQLNSCDIFCMTRINSQFANAGFPFKLGEFLATGKAVIATNVGDVSKYIQNKKNALLIKPSSVDEIADALTYILQNPAQISLLGAEGRKTAKANFDSDEASQKLLTVFNSV